MVELGSLPEWFTACAEVLAVVVALFLPQYRAYQDRKESYARMLRVTTGMLEALANDREHLGKGGDPAKLQSAQDLQLYLRVAFFALSEPREIALRDRVARLYRQLVAPEVDLPALRLEIRALSQPRRSVRGGAAHARRADA